MGDGWVHEVKYDGYRMHARIDGGDIKLLTRTGLDWSRRYRRTIDALGSLEGEVGLSRRRAVRSLPRRSAVIQPSPGRDG